MKIIEILFHQKIYAHPLTEGPRIKNLLVEPGLTGFDNAKIDDSKIFLPNPSIFLSPCLSAYPLAVPTPTTSITPPFSFPAAYLLLIPPSRRRQPSRRHLSAASPPSLSSPHSPPLPFQLPSPCSPPCGGDATCQASSGGGPAVRLARPARWSGLDAAQ